MTAMTDDSPAPGRPARQRQRGWYIPWLFVGFFLVVFAANGVLVYIALTTYTGLETKNHFIKGINYNHALQGARAQAERGWQVKPDFVSTGERTGLVTVSLKDKHGNLLSGSIVSVTFYRPTAQGNDVDLTLPYMGDGRYGQNVELPLSGVWDLKLWIRHDTGDYQDQQRIWVK